MTVSLAELESWSVDDVVEWLRRLGVPQEVRAAFSLCGIDGGDLPALTDADLTNHLGCSQLQARKIRMGLIQLGLAYMPSWTNSSAAASFHHLLSPATSIAPVAPLLPPAKDAREPAGAGLPLPPSPPMCPALQPSPKASRVVAHLGELRGRLEAAQAALAALEGPASEAARRVALYGRGAQLLCEAGRLLEDSLQNLARTRVFALLEARTGGGAAGLQGLVPRQLLDDAGDRFVIGQANHEMRQAAQKAGEARAVLPGLPAIDERVLAAAEMSLFQHVLGSAAGPATLEVGAVASSKQMLERLLQLVLAAATWARAHLAACQQQDAALRAQAALKRGELDRFRSVLLQAAMQAAAQRS